MVGQAREVAPDGPRERPDPGIPGVVDPEPGEVGGLFQVRGGPGRPAVSSQVGPEVLPGEDQPIDPLGRLPELAEVASGVVVEGVEGPLGLVDPGLVEVVGGVADPVVPGRRLVAGPPLQPDREQGHLADQEHAEGRLRVEVRLEGLDATLDLAEVLLGDHDPPSGHPVLEAVGPRAFLTLGGHRPFGA